MFSFKLLLVSSFAASTLGAALNVNHTLAARAPIVFPPGWQVLNPCAIDTPDRILKSLVIRQMSDNSATTCMQTCDKSGYTYAGLQYGNECHCGRGVIKGTQSAPTAECNMQCAGDALQSCGGSWRMQIYYTLSTTAKEPPMAPGWSASYRCAVDVGDRVLLGDVLYTLGNNTPYNCQKYCQTLGFKYAGVEYTNECHCGTGLRIQPSYVDVSECYMNCAGDSNYDCGGPWRIQIYGFGGSTSSTSTTSTTSTTTTTTTTMTTTTTTTSHTSTTSQTQGGTTSTTSTSTSSASTATQTSYGQCGGKGWTGPTQCGNGWACTYNSEYYSQCTYTGDTTKVQPYGQCGGKGWTGGTECSKGYSCVYSDAFFSQCLPTP